MAPIADLPMDALPFSVLIKLTCCNHALSREAKRVLLLRDRGVDLYSYVRSLPAAERKARLARMPDDDLWLLFRAILARNGIREDPVYIPSDGCPVIMNVAGTVGGQDVCGHLHAAGALTSLFGRAQAIFPSYLACHRGLWASIDAKARAFLEFLGPNSSDGEIENCAWETGSVCIFRVYAAACAIEVLPPYHTTFESGAPDAGHDAFLEGFPADPSNIFGLVAMLVQ